MLDESTDAKAGELEARLLKKRPAKVIEAPLEKPALAGFSAGDVSRIIEMAWEDRTSFEAIERQFGINESSVIRIMRAEMKASSFRMWRKRMNGRSTKHEALRSPDMNRHRASHTRQA
jgi:uncharacterized protein (TIGR03643 family)